MALETGQKAPDFTLADDVVDQVTLSPVRGRSEARNQDEYLESLASCPI